MRWSYDFQHDRTEDGRAFRRLAILDEYTRECLAMDVARRMSHRDVMDRLAELFIERGVPECISPLLGMSEDGSILYTSTSGASTKSTIPRMVYIAQNPF